MLIDVLESEMVFIPVYSGISHETENVGQNYKRNYKQHSFDKRF